VALQPDLGTVIVLAGVWLVTMVAWGVSWRGLAALLGVGLALVPLLFIAVPAYQRERLAVFLDPNRDPLGSGFNLRQVEVAIGTGGVTGHGLFSGAESHLDSVAARSSDFMFGFLGAELGLLGGLFLIALFALVVTRAFAAAARAPDPFGRLLAVALAAMVLTQAVVNIGVNLRLFPTTGIPLPFISQGGSALVAMLIAAGLLQSVAARRPATSEEQWKAERWL
jgi:rod shape determining protein RodA